MPINYTLKNYDHYKIKWEEFFNYCNTIPIFKDKKVQTKFLLSWTQKLKKLDSNSQLRKDFHSIEHFPLNLKIDGQTISWIAVNIDEIEKTIYKEQLAFKSIETNMFMVDSKFTNLNVPPYANHHCILYNKTTGYPEILDIPILIFDTIYSNSAIVIDGNHRLNTILNQNSKFINAYILNEIFLVKHPHCFFDAYSRELFTFWYEIHLFTKLTYQRNSLSQLLFSDNKLLKKYSNLSLNDFVHPLS